MRGITCVSASSGPCNTPSSLHSELSRCKGLDDRIVQHLSAPKRVVSHRAISCLTFRLGHIRDNKWDKCGICYKSPSLRWNFSCRDRHLRARVSSVLVVGVRKNCLFFGSLSLSQQLYLCQHFPTNSVFLPHHTILVNLLTTPFHSNPSPGLVNLRVPICPEDTEPHSNSRTIHQRSGQPVPKPRQAVSEVESE